MKTNSSNATTANTAPTLDDIRAALTAAGINPDAAEKIIRDRYGITDPEPAADEIGTACRLHITTHSDGGKLAGLISIGTPATVNIRCQRRQRCASSICAKCYAEALLAMRKGLSDGLMQNADILSGHILTPAETPRFDGRQPVRVESFGDTMNPTHAANYILMARRNPATQDMAVWTKNPDHYRDGLQIIGGEWPENLSLIYSVPTVDPVDLDGIAARMKEKYPFIAGVFAVYSTREKARAAGHPVNCAHRPCLHCLKCYRASAAGPVVIITELLKSRQNAETRQAHTTARAYLDAVAGYLPEKRRDDARRDAVRTAAAMVERTAASIGTDPTPEDFTRAALASLMQRYDTVTWTDDRAALIAAGIPAETLDSARRTATTARTAPRA